MHSPVFIILFHLPKSILLEVVARQFLQFVPVLCLFVVIHAYSLQAVVVYVVFIHPLYQFLQLLSPVQCLIKIDKQSQTVLQGIVVSVDAIKDEQGILILSTIVEDIRPFQQYLAQDAALVMLYLLSESICSGERAQALVLLSLPQQFVRLIQIVIDLVVQFRISHSLHLRPEEVKHIDLENKFAIRRNQGYSLLHSISVFRGHYQPQFFVLSYLGQAQLQTFYQSIPAKQKLGDLIALATHNLRSVDQEDIDLTIDCHSFFHLSSRAVPQSILKHMEGYNNFLYAYQSILRQTRIISILFNMIQHIIIVRLSRPDQRVYVFICIYRFVFGRSERLLSVGQIRMDMEYEHSGKNVKNDEKIFETKEIMDNEGERSETTDKRSKATDESFPSVRKQAPHRTSFRTSHKMENVSDHKVSHKEQTCNQYFLTSIISKSLEENELLRYRVIELQALLAQAISQLNEANEDLRQNGKKKRKKSI